MAASSKHIAQLLYKHLSDTLEGTELTEFNAWLAASPSNRRFAEELEEDGTLGKLILRERLDARDGIEDLLLQRAKSRLDFREAAAFSISRRVPLLRRWWAAAIIGVLATGATVFLFTDRQSGPGDTIAAGIDIDPGKEGAVLTLADGSQVVLDSLGNGLIATQNGTRVVLEDGRLAYDLTGSTAGEMTYNTMSTPKGRQFRVLLPDGTMVWLNAASSIRYPTVFTGKERKVEISGEAYFEVAADAGMPFKINVNNTADINVLGTDFNVNAYENEASINTTLIRGSIRVAVSRDKGQANENRQAVLLKPGQQARIWEDGKNSRNIQVQNEPNIKQVLAWKEGVFDFEAAGFSEVMKQMERWYDISVIYEKNIPETRFGGSISMNIPLSQLLKQLEFMGLHFRMEQDRTLVILP